MSEKQRTLKIFIDDISERNTFQPIRYFVLARYNTTDEDLVCTFFNWLLSNCYLRHAPHSLSGDVYMLSKVGRFYLGSEKLNNTIEEFLKFYNLQS